MNPVLGRIIIKSEQIILVLFQIFYSLLIFYCESLYELVIGFQCVLPCVCHVHVPNHLGRFFLNTFWHLVQNVRRFVEPATLNFHLSPDFINCILETQRSITDCKFGSLCKPPGISGPREPPSSSGYFPGCHFPLRSAPSSRQFPLQSSPKGRFSLHPALILHKFRPPKHRHTPSHSNPAFSIAQILAASPWSIGLSMLEKIPLILLRTRLTVPPEICSRRLPLGTGLLSMFRPSVSFWRTAAEFC